MKFLMLVIGEVWNVWCAHFTINDKFPSCGKQYFFFSFSLEVGYEKKLVEGREIIYTVVLQISWKDQYICDFRKRKPESRNMKPAAESWDSVAIIIVAGARSNNWERTDIKAPSYEVPHTYVTAVDISERHPQTAKGESSAEDALKREWAAEPHHTM